MTFEELGNLGDHFLNRCIGTMLRKVKEHEVWER